MASLANWALASFVSDNLLATIHVGIVRRCLTGYESDTTAGEHSGS